MVKQNHFSVTEPGEPAVTSLERSVVPLSKIVQFLLLLVTSALAGAAAWVYSTAATCDYRLAYFSEHHIDPGPGEGWCSAVGLIGFYCGPLIGGASVLTWLIIGYWRPTRSLLPRPYSLWILALLTTISISALVPYLQDRPKPVPSSHRRESRISDIPAAARVSVEHSNTSTMSRTTAGSDSLNHSSHTSGRAETQIKMPGSTKLWAPSRDYYVENEEVSPPETSTFWMRHRLLVKRPSGKVIYAYPYGRGCAISWAPDRDDLVITDSFGAGMSTVILVRFSPDVFRRGHPDVTKVGYLLVKHATGGHDLIYYDNMYIGATRWDGESIAVAVYAYGWASPIHRLPTIHRCFKYDYPLTFKVMRRDWCGPQPGVDY